jgi:glucosyl-3-phosphoglycerate synthase
MSAVLTPMIRTFRAGEFDARRLTDLKQGQRISVCLPARDEEGTVGPIVEAIRSELVDRVALVDELLVIDDHSSDRTADRASAAGAEVIDASLVLPAYGSGHGKGEALWKSLYACSGDLVVWCDADVRLFDPSFVTGLVGPLLATPGVEFVKGFYERPLEGQPTGGGRVTELVARPVIALLFPELAPIVQPLAGEYAGRRSLLERLPFVQGYGVDIALLIDAAAAVGTEHLAQVDLGVRHHRNRGLDQLAPQAAAVLQAALRRADPRLVDRVAMLRRPGADAVEVDCIERPPLIDVPEYLAPRPSELRV